MKKIVSILLISIIFASCGPDKVNQSTPSISLIIKTKSSKAKNEYFTYAIGDGANGGSFRLYHFEDLGKVGDTLVLINKIQLDKFKQTNQTNSIYDIF